VSTRRDSTEVDTVAYQPAHLAEFIGRSASSALTPALIRPGIYVIWPEHEKPGGSTSGRVNGSFFG